MAHITRSSFTGEQEGGRKPFSAPEILDKKYEDDLEKAIALSVESQKLEDMKREQQKEGGGTKSAPATSVRSLTTRSRPQQHSESLSKPSSVGTGVNIAAAAVGTTGSNAPDLMSFSFDHVIKNYDAPRAERQGNPGQRSSYGRRSVPLLSRPQMTFRPPPAPSSQFPAAAAAAAHPAFQRQSSAGAPGSAFLAPVPASDTTQWIDPLLTQLSSGILPQPSSKLSPPSPSFDMYAAASASFFPTGFPVVAAGSERLTTSTLPRNVPSGKTVTSSSPQWQHMKARHSDDMGLAYHSYNRGRVSPGGAANFTALDAAKLPSATSVQRPAGTGVVTLQAAETNSLRRINSNPDFQSWGGQGAVAAPGQGRPGAHSPHSPQGFGSTFRQAQLPSETSTTLKSSSHLVDEIWNKTFGDETDVAVVKPGDLMVFSPKSTEAPTAVFDVSEFDPLRPSIPEPAKEKPEEIKPTGDVSKPVEDGVVNEKSDDGESSQVPKVELREPKTKTNTRRPNSDVGYARPKSGPPLVGPEPWIPGSKFTQSAGRKAEASKVFFGDGLFDLATEKDEEVAAFSYTVERIRRSYRFDDPATNPGYIHSPVFVNHCHADMETSVKVVLLQSGAKKPIIFTCDVNICVQHVISQALCYIGASDISSETFVLKVPGLAEYLRSDVKLSSYEYVQECLKLDRDVRLVLLHRAEMKTSLARTAEDDDSDISKINFLSLFDRPITTSVSKKGLDVLLAAFTEEGDKMLSAVKSGYPLKTGPLVQTVKAICFTLATVEPNEITTAIHDLKTAPHPVPAYERITAAVLQLVDMYCTAFDTDFHTGPADEDAEPAVQDIKVKGHNLRVCIASAHRLPSNVKNAHESFSVTAQLYYGGNSLHSPVDTWPARINSSFFDKLAWNQNLELPVPVSQLSREARLILTLFGHGNSTTDARNADKSVIGWVAIPMFNFNCVLQAGRHLLGLWADPAVNPIGTCSSNLLTQTSIILQVNFEDTKTCYEFPTIQAVEEDKVYKFDMLEKHNQYKIREILDENTLATLNSDDAAFLWTKRHYLHDFPLALPRILEVAPSWDWACLADIYSLLRHWKPVKPVQTLQLLHPRFADREVRCTAVQWMQCIADDELCDYLPQFVQALKYESYHDSALARFLIERSIQNIRVSHYLYWCLKDSLREQQYKQRIEMILGALLSVCSKGLRHQFRLQEAFIENLNSVAEQIKAAKDINRMLMLRTSLDSVASNMRDTIHMPTNPSLEIKGINTQNCGYFNSFTVPLKLVMDNADPLADDVTVMYKAGEDMRQDMLTMQMIRIMDKLWLSEGLDLRMITFRCMATGPNRGLVELVGESETLRKIQMEHGLTGSFKEKPLAEWLQKHNPTELDYQKAVENFTYSCAGYCVATYVLGIGDRHNDNIMVARTGHMFHVDFGKFLGNAQMFGSIKRDRTPFVLTPEMAYVINGGEKQSSRFQNFVDLCSEAFNLVRNHADIFFNLFGLMLNAGIGQLTKSEDLNYVHNALNPKASNTEATTMITRLIEASLGSKATQINFFIHNLAQHSFTAANSQELSFAPKRYTLATDGKISAASMYGIQKRYETEKYYVYIVSIVRDGSSIPTFIFRRYSEFSELTQKLAILHPQARCFSLSSGPLVGRTHVKQVAEKRRNELDLFLRQLFSMASEVSQCDLVYTFFHPSLRDEKDAHLANKSVKLKNDPSQESVEPTVAPGEVSGRVQLAITYRNNALLIMVRHATSLLALDKGEPDPYIKTYLLPDPHKQTKRKTRVQKKTSNPTYNEMLVYNLPWSEVLKRTIRLTAWDSDYLKENNFLGGKDIPVASLDLSEETVAWYKLGNLT